MLTETSCVAKPPLIKLDDDGVSNIIRYNIPQIVKLNVGNFVPFDINEQAFTDEASSEPGKSFWNVINSISAEDLLKIINGEKLSDVKVLDNLARLTYSCKHVYDPTTGLSELSYTDQHESEINPEFVTNSYIAWKIKQGYMPVIQKRLSKKKRLKFKKDPGKPSPQLYMVLNLGIVSVPGAYGAGQTVNSFSLLPGEKTTISIRTYEKTEETLKKSENIIDSFSESSSEEFQQTVEEATENSYSTSASTTDTDTDEYGAEINPDVSFNILGIGFDVSGTGAEASSSRTTTSSFNTALSSTVKTLNSSINKVVNTSNYERTVEVNTEYTYSSTEEAEQTITREIENINKSRVLNFIFRQLVQEYTTITYLKDVAFVFTNGYPDCRKTCDLSGLDDLLEYLITKPETAASLKDYIIRQLCNIKDYKGDVYSFIELIKEELNSCINPTDNSLKNTYIRKKKDLVQTDSETGVTVDGIILDITKRVMRTPAVIAEAVQGRGEALDCYNMQLQEAAYTSAQLENEKVKQMIEVVNGITDPVEKAKLYKKVFGDCCDVPQSCCCDCSSENSNTENI